MQVLMEAQTCGKEVLRLAHRLMHTLMVWMDFSKAALSSCTTYLPHLLLAHCQPAVASLSPTASLAPSCAHLWTHYIATLLRSSDYCLGQVVTILECKTTWDHSQSMNELACPSCSILAPDQGFQVPAHAQHAAASTYSVLDTSLHDLPADSLVCSIARQGLVKDRASMYC